MLQYASATNNVRASAYVHDATAMPFCQICLKRADYSLVFFLHVSTSFPPIGQVSH